VRRILIILLLLPTALVAAVVGAWFLVPDSWIRGRLEAAVRAATGRDFAVHGDFRLGRWPVRLEASDLVLVNAPWAREPEMARIGRLAVVVDVAALVRGQVRLTELAVADGRIVLERAADGRANWRFGAGGEAGPAAGGEDGGRGWPLVLERARITALDLVFDDAGGRRTELAGLDLDLRRDLGTGALRLEGSARLDGEAVTLTGVLADPRRVRTGEGGPVRLDLRLARGALRFDGRLQGPDPAVRGRLDLAFEDLRGFLATWGVRPEGIGAEALRTLALAAEVEATVNAVRLADLTLALDHLRGEGTLSLARTGARPRLVGELAFGRLDLDPYLPPGPADGAAAEADGGEAEAGWSEEPLALPLPAPVDAELVLRFAGVRVRGLEFGAGRVELVVEGSRARIAVPELALYEGEATGTLDVTAGKIPDLALDLRVEGVRARPLLAALAALDRLEGRGFAEAELRSRGASPKALVAALTGRGRVEFRDGAILGINLAAMVRRVTSLGLAAEEAPRRTDFARLAARFTVTEGILRTDDITLEAPLFRLRGGGTVDLPARTLDLRLEPALAATLEGQGGGPPRFAVAVPVVLSGPWAAPSWRFDIGGRLTEAVRDPAAVEALVARLRGDPDAVRRLGARFAGAQALLGVEPEGLQRLLPGLGGAAPGDGTERARPTPVPDPRRLLPRLPGAEASPAAREGEGAGAREPAPGPEDLLRGLLGR